MATVRQSNFNWDGKPFWGLVQQNGPWANTVNDQKRASMKDTPTIGGGIGAGGRAHAGNANFEQVMTPYQINATNAPPPPSEYAMRSVMMAPIDMKRATKMGSTKMKLTLGARLRMGSKMGNVKQEITRLDPGNIMPPIKTESTTTFGSTHHLMEMPDYFPANSDYDTASEGGDHNIMHFGGNQIEQNTVPTIKSHVPFIDQMDASTTARDDERQAVMGRQIENIDSNYQEAQQFTLPGREYRATRQDPLFGPERAPPGIRKSTGLTAAQSRKNLGKIITSIGQRFGVGRAENKSRPNRYDELPDRKTRRKKPEMMQVSQF